MNELQNFIRYLEKDLRKSLLIYYRDVSQKRNLFELNIDFGSSYKDSKILEHAFKLVHDKTCYNNVTSISHNLISLSHMSNMQSRVTLIHDLYVIKKIQLKTKSIK